ncbi:hydroxymethylglutaryl-CoA lyase [Parasphingopyxis lamellibrachiae]|uniref:Hydroxymethylglutaryl-CoA lyase n=1 Tax=Parasphingopyxis lamellibrachiae TaxID=680125 RepID=A0A3D9FI86_9SPHN|nr:hydroxymethylglutaryl-CoA lyase [Parasphingopyxis lamellibrachiae]RED17338.1 hydroxymethylglutaryl-CoA lyase [Parasphingopyxis lamellibrachiae]
MPRKTVEIVEVAPRDGLQNEARQIPTAEKLRLVEQAIAMGARRIEVTSFVNPKKVPQMADAEELMGLLPVRDDVTYIGLVLNGRGAERAIAAGVDELGAVCVASDEFGIRNQGQDRDQSVAVAGSIVRRAREAGLSGQVTIATAFGCPFEGKVPAARIVDMARGLAETSPREIALADTIGVGVPAQVGDLVAEIAEAIAPIPVRIHLHNTRNTGIANVWAAVEAGASTVDSSLGGLGGCPFAPGAAGNVATEDVVYMLEQSGVSTGMDLDRAIDASRWLSGVMERDLPAMVSKAPLFP